MISSSNFKPNPAFTKKQSAEPEMLAAFVGIAEGVADSIRLNAPVDTGQYRQSIKVTHAPTQVTVGSHDFAGHIIEWGSINSPAMAPIRRGVLAAGLRLDEQ